MNSLPKLHDATLKTLELQWATGVLRCLFDTAEGNAILHIEGVTLLNCPRLLPWGASISVNTASVQDDSAGIQLLLEMQSGDLLEVRGRSISVPAALQSN